jgi:hypothetical protein
MHERSMGPLVCGDGRTTERGVGRHQVASVIAELMPSGGAMHGLRMDLLVRCNAGHAGGGNASRRQFERIIAWLMPFGALGLRMDLLGHSHAGEAVGGVVQRRAAIFRRFQSMPSGAAIDATLELRTGRLVAGDGGVRRFRVMNIVRLMYRDLTLGSRIDPLKRHFCGGLRCRHEEEGARQ